LALLNHSIYPKPFLLLQGRLTEEWRMTRKKKRSINPRFQVGDKVRVQPGIRDVLFPDIPLDGWSGTVMKIVKERGQINYLFKWDDRTLAILPPTYRERCDLDGLDFEITILLEEELELDDGTTVSVEQPAESRPLPLSENDQDDRVRLVFGLTHDDPIPDVSFETLMTYYQYLVKNLKFPFFTSRWAKTGPFSRKKVVLPISRLEPPVAEEYDDECPLYGIGIDEDEEIEFEVPLEVIDVKKDDPNYRLISDYTYWSNTWRHT
jgi:Calcium binding